MLPTDTYLMHGPSPWSSC